MEFIHDLSKLKFNGEGESPFHVHILLVIILSRHHQINFEDVWAILLTLTFEGHAKNTCHTLPISFISSFRQLAKMMAKYFDKYSHQGVFEKICRLRMDLDESVKDFVDHFLHNYCEIINKILNSYLLW